MFNCIKDAGAGLSEYAADPETVAASADEELYDEESHQGAAEYFGLNQYNKIFVIFESEAVSICISRPFTLLDLTLTLRILTSIWVLLQTILIKNLEPTLREWETDAVRLLRDSFQVIETQELSDEGNENDDEGEGGSAESDEKGVQGEGSGGNIVKPSLLMDEFRVGIDELKKEREELKKERDELRKEKEELRKREERLDEREALLKEKELLKMERVDLNERVQLKKEKELFFIMNEELNRRMCELLRETENLAKERESLKKEKEYFYIKRGQFMRDEDEELKKKVKVEDMEEKE
ncbi:uncharacterized protein LOC131224729 [Magnolia sinica]|uniref:uncharacterized protein LOC131224729 n=1 Tax=Magnolia sinica TaxID=86752 RepID=UPI002658A8C4|nr:uncharacterized protein LOC131224729 [Magnolia sinica]